MRNLVLVGCTALVTFLCTDSPANAQGVGTKRVAAIAANNGASIKYEVGCYLYFSDGKLSPRIDLSPELAIGQSISVKTDVAKARAFTLYVTWLEKGPGTTLKRAARFDQPMKGAEQKWNAMTVVWEDSNRTSLPSGFEMVRGSLSNATPPP